MTNGVESSHLSRHTLISIIYERARDKDKSVFAHARWERDVQKWDVKYRDNLYEWEEEEMNNLKVKLEEEQISEDDDIWKWKGGQSGDFSVASFYEKINGNRGVENFPKTLIWGIDIPYKVKIFVWVLIWERTHLLLID
ncbi:hypothetical protein FRX31_016972 [Thalictrum thalictroides]|uniref:Reverse transcriptase zinc-binding domain-containing protein n=1 Tax=Thalictrum thalictroides TaxID=46969 RepID=A0A7J6W891_THATH|nr:hypothetical protein FRX31_016972 [Thalictrum thalictroides]